MVKINGLPFISPTIYQSYPDKVDQYYTNTNVSDTLTIPYGVKKITISLIGGGGGGAIFWNTSDKYFAGSGGGSGYIAHYDLVKGDNFLPNDILTVWVGAGGAKATSSTGNGGNGGASQVILSRAGENKATYTADGGEGAKKVWCNISSNSLCLSCGGNGGFGGGGCAPAWYNTIGDSFGGVGGYGGTMKNKQLTPGPYAYSLLQNNGQYVQYNGTYGSQWEGTVWMADRYSGGGAPVEGDKIVADSIYTGSGRFHLFTSNFGNINQYSQQMAGSVRGNYRAFCCMFEDLENSLYYLGPGGNGGQASAYESPQIQGIVPGAYGGGYLDAALNDNPPPGTPCGSGGRGQGVGPGATDASAGANGVVGIRMFYR